MSTSYVRVGEVLALQRREVLIDPLEEYQLIGVYSFGKGILHREPKQESELGDYRFFRVLPGDLVLSNIQAWEGAIAYAREADVGTIGTHRFLTYTAADDRVDTNWARWFFLSEPGMELVRRAAPGTVMRNRTLSIERFENLRIPLPPIEEQRRVAGGLDRLERGVRSLDALGQRSTFLAAATRSALVRGNDELLSWRPVSLNDVLSLRCDETRVEPDATYQMAGVYSFGRGLFARADLEGGRTSYKVLHKLVEGHLVMSRLKAWEGALALVPARFGGFFLSPEFPTFEINTDLADPHFLGALLTSEPFWSRLRGASKGIGARKERVNAKRLLEQEILLPPLAEQRARSAAIDRLTAVQEASTRRAVRAGALVPSAMNQVFASLS